jgi:hypothetical protein
MVRKSPRVWAKVVAPSADTVILRSMNRADRINPLIEPRRDCHLGRPRRPASAGIGVSCARRCRGGCPRQADAVRVRYGMVGLTPPGARWQ